MTYFKSFSPKQLRLLSWWDQNSPDSSFDGIICDGAVRSGKTFCMAISFFLWSFSCFKNQNFALCGKTISSIRRNLLDPLIPVMSSVGFSFTQKISKNYLDVSFQGVQNRFFLFSGRDESSASLIQGITLAGVLFDEVALMNHPFVEQAVARCSVENSRFWFNCNPEYPNHWFFTDWISKKNEKNLLYLHFTMKDNPSLSPKVRKRYQSIYSGQFFERFVLGKWVNPQGLIYSMFSTKDHVTTQTPNCSEFYVSCDYGTINPCSMGLWGKSIADDSWVRLAEFYHDSRKLHKIKTDEDYYIDLLQLVGDKKIRAVIVDPSAASFIACIRKHNKLHVVPANNDVSQGIRLVCDLLKQNKLIFHASCMDSIREFSLYRWNEKATLDQPVKQFDHAMDDIRYFAMAVCSKSQKNFFAIASKRF